MAKATGWQAPTKKVTSIPKVPITIWCFDPMPRKAKPKDEVVVCPTVEEVLKYGLDLGA